MTLEHRDSQNFEFEISGIDSLYDRLQAMINHSADNASPEELALMALLKPSLDSNNLHTETELPWANVTIPEYNKVIDADPLFGEVDVEIHGGLSIKDGEYAFTNTVFWFHRMAEQTGLSKEIVLKAPEIAEQMRAKLQGSTIELELADISEHGDREIVIRDTASKIGGHMYFGADVNDTQTAGVAYTQDEEDAERDLIAFELDLPTDKAGFAEAVNKVQRVIQEGINAVYKTTNLAPSYSMKLQVGFEDLQN